MAAILSIAIGALTAMVLVSLIAARAFPKGARVPMQWGVTGQPTWYAPVWLGVSFSPILASLVIGLAAALTFVNDKALNDFSPAVPAIAILFFVVHVVHLACAHWHFVARRKPDGST